MRTAILLPLVLLIGCNNKPGAAPLAAADWTIADVVRRLESKGLKVESWQSSDWVLIDLKNAKGVPEKDREVKATRFINPESARNTLRSRKEAAELRNKAKPMDDHFHLHGLILFEGHPAAIRAIRAAL